MIRRIEGWFVRTFSICAVIFGLSALRVDMLTWQTVELASSLGGEKVLSTDASARIVNRGNTWTAVGYCRRDYLLAAGRIAAAAVDGVIAAGDIDRVAAALDLLERTAQAILNCSPAESIAWTWVAMARSQLGGNDEYVERLLARSQWTAPSDLAVISIRLPEIARNLSRRGDLFAPLARADIRTLFAAEHSAWDTARILGPVFAWIGPIAQEEFRSITDALHRDALIQSLGYQRANIVGCTRERFIDWLYRGQRGTCDTGDRIPDFDWSKSDQGK